MESYRRDRLTPWEASFLLLRAGKVRPGGGAVPAMFLSLLIVVISIWVAGSARDPVVPAAARAFFALAILSTGATSLMATFETGRAEALRFLLATPQPVAPKWLLFLPFGSAGILIALAALSLIPPLAAVALLGCWCWAAAVGHWCAGRALTILVGGWLLSFAPVVVAAFSYDSSGWAPAAATAAALGSIGWLASPRDRVAVVPARADATNWTSGVRRVRHSARRWTALRMLFLGEIFARRGLSFALVLSLVGAALVALVNPQAVVIGATQVFSCAGFLAAANTQASLDFLATRPISRSQRLRGMVLPWLLLAAVVPAAALLGARAATTIEPGQMRQLAYPRDVILAAWAPTPAEQAAPATNPVAVSPALRRLLLGHVGRAAVLQLGLFACTTAWYLSARRSPRRRRLRWISITLTVISVGLFLPFCLRFRLPLVAISWAPSAWQIAPVAALDALVFVREVWLDARSPV